MSTAPAFARAAEIEASLESQRKLQMEAEAKAMGTAKTYETPKRAAEQEQLAASIEQSNSPHLKGWSRYFCSTSTSAVCQ